MSNIASSDTSFWNFAIAVKELEKKGGGPELQRRTLLEAISSLHGMNGINIADNAEFFWNLGKFCAKVGGVAFSCHQSGLSAILYDAIDGDRWYYVTGISDIAWVIEEGRKFLKLRNG